MLGEGGFLPCGSRKANHGLTKVLTPFILNFSPLFILVNCYSP